MMGHGGGGFMGGGGRGPGGPWDGWDDERLGRVYDRQVVARLLPYLAPYKGWGALALSGMLVFTAASVAIPWLIGHTVDTAIATRDMGTLSLLSLLFLGTALASALGNFLQMLYMAKIAQDMLVRLRSQLFDHLQTLSLGFFDRSQVGRLMSRVINDVEQIQQVLTGGIIGTLGDALSLVGIVAVMFWMSPTLAAVALSTAPVLLLIAIFWQGRAREAFMDVRRAISVVNGSLQENVSGVRVVQSLRREDENLRRFERVNREHLDANLRASRLTAAMFPAVEVLVGVATALVIVVGGWMALRGSLEVGTLVAFGLYVQRFFDPIRNITMQYTELQRAMASGVRIFELLDTQPQVADTPDAQEIAPVRGRVTFTNVSFAYQPSIPVLHAISLDVEPG
ncbi:MAG: ABC transporter ATP-binding protein, partial [Chloroflexi bacterium]|nr:ABC transporter ATP-binding protein [Chloroflexota bacterium]